MITYFVLKTDGGRTAGCVRLEHDRARSSCPCLLVLEDGSTLPIDEAERTVPLRPLGALALRGGKLLAWGTMPQVRMRGAELLYLVRQREKALSASPEPIVEEPTIPAPPPQPAEPEPPAPAEISPAPEAAPLSVGEEAPAGAPKGGLLDAEEAVPKASPWAPDSPAAPDSASAAADFGLLVRHAGEVYDALLHPPLPPVSDRAEAPTAAASAGNPAQEAPAAGSSPHQSRENWFQETDRLLRKPRPLPRAPWRKGR